MMSSGTTLDRLPLPHTRMPKGMFYAAGGMILKGPPQPMMNKRLEVSPRLMDPTCPTCPMAKKRGGKC
jgi:hypothetical protein